MRIRHAATVVEFSEYCQFRNPRRRAVLDESEETSKVWNVRKYDVCVFVMLQLWWNAVSIDNFAISGEKRFLMESRKRQKYGK